MNFSDKKEKNKLKSMRNIYVSKSYFQSHYHQALKRIYIYIYIYMIINWSNFLLSGQNLPEFRGVFWPEIQISVLEGTNIFEEDHVIPL
jgi:hypothetical protein